MVPLADGFEEMEALTIVDILRRAGLKVETVGVVGSTITGAHGVRVLADRRLMEISEDYDAIVLPGGSPGYINLSRTARILEILKKMNDQGKTIAAICASPSVLAKAGILENKKATIYPGMEREIPRPRAERVVVDGNVITSQGPGTTIEFALKLVEVLVSREKASEIRRDLVV
jgi:4-methyl-5(b-hydroxyethyl)-thiazole monophosphate biosynthesis